MAQRTVEPVRQFDKAQTEQKSDHKQQDPAGSVQHLREDKMHLVGGGMFVTPVGDALMDKGDEAFQ